MYLLGVLSPFKVSASVQGSAFIYKKTRSKKTLNNEIKGFLSCQQPEFSQKERSNKEGCYSLCYDGVFFSSGAGHALWDVCGNTQKMGEWLGRWNNDLVNHIW